MKTTAAQHFIRIGIALLQLLDIAVHAATDQLEVMRVASNLLILLWLAVGYFGRSSTNFFWTASASIVVYLFLNLLFLAQAGLANPEQSGGLRIALFLFVSLTAVFSLLLVFIVRKHLSAK
jgi:hypothetical protein